MQNRHRSAPTTAGLRTGNDGTAECASSSERALVEAQNRIAQLDQALQQGDRPGTAAGQVWILVYSGGRTGGTAAMRHGPTEAT